jgi:hypothetical protein
MDTVLFLTIGKTGDVLMPYIGKTGIGELTANFNIYWPLFLAFQCSDKNLLPTYLNFYANRYPPPPGLPIVRKNIVFVYPIDFSAFSSGISVCTENR